MRGKKKPGGKKYLPLILVLTAITLFFFGHPDELYANSEPIQTSGTPILHWQRIRLLQNLSSMSTIHTEINQIGKIFADEVNDQAYLWAYNFRSKTYYQTWATCKNK